MSLINEALKKAQRSRTAGAEGTMPPTPGGRHIAKLGPARSANMMVLLGSGAVVLVVLSVVITIYLLNRPSSTPAPVIAAAKPPAPSAPATATVTPSIPPAPSPGRPSTESTPPAPPPTATARNTPPQLAPLPAAVTSTPPPAAVATNPPPVTPAPTRTQSPTVSPAPTQRGPDPIAANRPASAPVVSPAPRPTSSPNPAPSAIVTSPPATPKIAAPAPAPDERIAAFVESIRIAGVRSTGPEAKVLIGGRTFKVNDIIDRNLGVRLVNVAPGVLTFADANGVTYAKNH